MQVNIETTSPSRSPAVTIHKQNSLVEMAYLNEKKAAPKRDG
jgi:hypothetical protein